MKRNSSPYRSLRKLTAIVWPIVACLLVLSLATMAQTIKTTSNSRLASRAAARASALKVSFTYGPRYPTAGQTVQFVDASTGSATSWLWEFGDGSTSTEKNPSHKYLTSGFRKVSLLAGSSAGSKKSSRTIIVMPEATNASFAYSPTTPGPGQTVQFADTTSENPTSWQWNFDDGSTSNVKNPSHAFLRAGLYTVTLVSSDGSGSRQGSRTITVASTSLLSTSFTYAPALPSAGQAVQFADTSMGSPASWLWDFGDGMSSTAQNPVHNFAAAGYFNVTLTVANGSESKSMSRSITVAPAAALDARFTYSPISPVEGQAILFTDASIGSPASWLWDFADGTASTSQSTSHTYASPGAHNVSLTVTSGSGSSSMSQAINVLPASVLTADFAHNPSSPVLGQAVSFLDASIGNPTSWQWDFGDGSTSNAQNPSYTYATAGAYSVALTISAGSSSSTQSKNIVVTYSDVITAASPSFADVSAAVSRAKAGDTVIVPAGRATWASQLVITRGINLTGAGIGQTVIISNYVAPNPDSVLTSANYLIVYDPTSPLENAPFRLSGFSLDFDHKCFGLMLENTSTTAINQIRIDNNHMEDSNVGTDLPWQGVNIHIYGTVYGVADRNEFISGYIRCNGLDATTWNNLEFNFGTADNFYFEDNRFTSPDTMFFYGEMGGRYCVRYNIFDATASTNGLYPFADMHGNQPNAHNATMGAEIYENVINAGIKGVCLLDQRGGKALVYNNVISTSGTVFAQAREEYLDSISPPESSLKSGQPQHVSDSYYWSNRKNGTTIIGLGIEQRIDYGGNLGVVPQENRDVWFEKSGFNGTSGVGFGPLANRPTTCTTGVAYWATDTNILYKCTKKNVWTEYYRPYVYPHPLRK